MSKSSPSRVASQKRHSQWQRSSQLTAVSSVACTVLHVPPPRQFSLFTPINPIAHLAIVQSPSTKQQAGKKKTPHGLMDIVLLLLLIAFRFVLHLGLFSPVIYKPGPRPRGLCLCCGNLRLQRYYSPDYQAEVNYGLRAEDLSSPLKWPRKGLKRGQEKASRDSHHK